MGLEAVELVMDVEDHFGITIQDAEAGRILTVGDLVALIRGRVAAAQSPACPTVAAFLALRRVVRETVHDAAFRLRPRDRVTSLLPRRLRRQLWRRLPDLLGTSPRSLQRPPLLRKVLAAISIGVLLWATAVAAVNWQILPLTWLLAAVIIWLLYVATTPFCTLPPNGWVKLGDLARQVAGTVAAMTDRPLDDDEAILRELRPIVVAALGVEEAQVVPAARFVEDLGMG